MGRGRQGNRYILTVIDLFTKYAGAYPIKDKKATTVAREFMTRWVLEGGRIPRALLSDNGGEFINEVMEEMNKMWKIERKCTRPYHSRANGGVERLNRTITETLRRLVGRTDEWEESLPYAVYCYNTVPHGVTGESPAFLFYGRDKRLPLGESWKVDERYAGDMDDYKSQMMMLMKKTQVEVNERLSGERERMKREYDKRRENNNGNEPVVGDRFYAFKENGNERNPKLRTKWEGPYRVIGRSSTTATIEGIEDGKERVVQLDKLRRVPRVEMEIGVHALGKTVHSSVIVDAGSPLHWESRCPEYAKDPRKLKELWKKCPDQYANFSFEKLKEYALMRSLIERWTMDWRFFLEGIDDTYNVAYHRGLGEDVESSCGHAAILLSPNLDLPSNGGDTARFEWRETVSEEWENTLRRWDGERARKKPIAKILIFWPRMWSIENRIE